MPCFHPIDARQFLDGTILTFGKIQNRRPTYRPPNFKADIQLPCGRCIGCRMQTASNWAVRCLHESQLHECNSFLTLTIDQERASASQTRLNHGASTVELSKSIHKKFIKRLRKQVGTVRYYMCGEYGEKLSRPHYHYLVFGYAFPDKTYWKKTDSGASLYISQQLNQLWPFGHAYIGDVTYESCAYVASYVLKKITGPKAEDHYRRQDEAGNDYWLPPEFNLMSRNPGIAREWWNNFRTDITTDDAVVRLGNIRSKPPRYYDKLLELFDPQLYELIKSKRAKRATELAGDNTPARLEVKETVAKAKANLKQRRLEQ